MSFPSSACRIPMRSKKLKEKYAKEVDRYRDEQKDIESDAKKSEDDVKLEGRRADRFDLGEVMLEAALGDLLDHAARPATRIFWAMGLVLGLSES